MMGPMPPTPPLRNWSENHTYRAAVLHEPRSDDELREVVAGAGRLKVLGSRHCFNDIADSDALVSLDRMADVFELRVPGDGGGNSADDDAATVTVNGSARYGTVATRLHAAGWAVHNLASLPHISVAGAISTATHGSGNRSRNLAGAVVGLELVTADGRTMHLAEGDADFPGAVVGLGALGVVTRVTLRVEPTYDVVQRVSTGLPFSAVLENLEAITASADSVSLFTDWREPVVAQVWRKDRVRPGDGVREVPDQFGAVAAVENLHPLAGMDPAWATAQLGVPGPWFERWPHFRMEFTPSNGAELQSEYLVAREDGPAALEAVRSLADRIAPLLLIGEIRTVAADDLWLSTAYGRDSLALHLTWQPREAEVRALLPDLERALEPFDARPHWGKLFTAEVAGAPDRLAELYPRLPDFRALATRLDPTGKWSNPYLTRHALH